MRRLTWELGLLAGLMLATVLAGCASNPVENTGKLDVALLGVSPSGTVYRLRQASLTVQGPASTTFFNTEEDPNRTTLSADVVAGEYSVFLQEGWHLERIAADGSGVRVQATFLSANPQLFTVSANSRTVVNLHFRAGPDDVVMDQGSFDIVLQVDDPGPTPIVNCTTAAECGAGQTCCLSGFLGTCQTLAAGASCPLPDLIVSLETAQNSITIGHRDFPASSCAIAEGCVNAAGDRRLLSFSTQTPNIGQADMILGDPTSQPGFEFSTCHNHFHFEGYANYELLDATGNVAATGHKQAFCLLDSTPVLPDANPSPRYHCSFQGIQRGWSDIYGNGLDCQWVDITGVAEGDYRLRITINPTHILPESNYDNNTIEVPVHIAADVPPVPGDPLSPCPNAIPGPTRECGWAIATGFEAATCTPGATVTLGCGCATVGTCAGDPMLRVCDGANTACSAGSALFNVDDACGLCPQGSFVCPASGTYTVMRGAFNAGQPFTCEPAVAP
jgi:Lysyl oxidase